MTLHVPCSNTDDTITLEEERKKIYIPSETRRIVEEEDNKERPKENPSAVSAVFSALAGGNTQKESSPSSSDRGYGSDRSSDIGEGTTEAKKILYASDTFKAVKEDETQRPSFGSGKPAQSRTLSMLQKQLE